MAVSYPVAADSSPTGPADEPSPTSETGDGAPVTWPGVRNGSGSQPEPASSSSARSAISLFVKCSMNWAAVSPLASRTGSSIEQLLRPRLEIEPGILMGLVPCNGGDALHEVEDALGLAALLGKHRVNDLGRFRLAEAALAQ